MAIKLFGRTFGHKDPQSELSGDSTIMDDSVIEPQSAGFGAAGWLSHLPVLVGKSVAEQLRMLGLLLALFAFFAAALTIWQLRSATQGTAYVSAAGQMRTLSQRLAKAAQQTLQGNAQAFVELKESRERFEQLLKAVTEGGEVDGTRVSSGSSSVRSQLEALTTLWEKTDKDSKSLLGQQTNLSSLAAAVTLINSENPKLLDLSE